MLFEIDICSFYLQKVHKVINICVFHEFYINPPNALIQTRGVSSEIKDHSNHRTTLVTHTYNKAINYLANQLGWCQWRSQPSDTSWSATQSLCTTMGERRRWTGFTTSPLNVPLFLPFSTQVWRVLISSLSALSLTGCVLFMFNPENSRSYLICVGRQEAFRSNSYQFNFRLKLFPSTDMIQQISTKNQVQEVL